MKKVIIFGFILGLLSANLMLAKPVHALSIHDSPWCDLVFWRDGYCDTDDNSDSAPAPAPSPAQNHPPIFSGGQTAFNIKTGDLLQFSVTAFDPDADPITYSVAFLPTGASFNSETKTFSWTPSNSQSGTYLVQFSAYDGKAYAFESVTINVSGNSGNGNHKPVWNNIGDQNAYVGQTLQFTVSATDADNNVIAYNALNLPYGATFESSSRTFSWIPTQNQIGTHVVTFTVYDGQDQADMDVTIRVSFPNNKPYFTNANPPSRAKIGQLYSYNLNAVDIDNDPLTYSLPTAPLGMAVNPSTGFIQWTPSAFQTGFNYVLASVSDGKSQTTFGFYIFVESENGAPVQNPNPPVHPKPITSEKLKTSGIKIENVDGDIVVSWQTNLPAKARVIYDTTSQAERVRNFTYANATPQIEDLTTDHKVNLGKLEIGTVYYLRVVSKTADQMAISQEVVFIELEGGKVNSLFGASLFQIFGKLFTNTVFLWLMIILMAITAFVFYRKHQKASSPL